MTIVVEVMLTTVVEVGMPGALHRLRGLGRQGWRTGPRSALP
jgi:hypothetical protein